MLVITMLEMWSMARCRIQWPLCFQPDLTNIVVGGSCLIESLCLHESMVHIYFLIGPRHDPAIWSVSYLAGVLQRDWSQPLPILHLLLAPIFRDTSRRSTESHNRFFSQKHCSAHREISRATIVDVMCWRLREKTTKRLCKERCSDRDWSWQIVAQGMGAWLLSRTVSQM